MLATLAQLASSRLPVGLRARVRRIVSAPTLVLLYHRVLPEVGPDLNQLAVSCENFAGHLAWLAGRALVLSEAEFLDHLDSRRRARRPRVLLTFDDGYADVVAHARPLLAQRGVRATLFVVSDALATGQPFWWDEMERIVCGAPLRGLSAGLAHLNLALPVPGSTADAFAALRTAFQAMPAAEREQRLSELARAADAPPAGPDRPRPANWDELTTWLRAGLSVGAHTCTHPRLAGLPADEIRSEITRSKTLLEERLRRPIRTLAYPFGGRADFDPHAVLAARQAGFACAFANRPGNVRWARDRFNLPRHLVRNWPPEQFAEIFTEWCR